MFANVYRGRKVFITGHTGFKGSWLCAWLLGLGADVAGYALEPPSAPANFEALHLAEKMRDIRGDIRDREKLAQAMRAFAPEIVFHLAARALVRDSYEDPVGTFATNVMGTVNVLECLRAAPSARAAVLVTSDKCYHNNEWLYGYRETDRLGGDDPYSASKGCAELAAQSYFQSFYKSGPACATARAGNVVGGGDWAKDRIVPDCARAWASAAPVVIRSPKATRPWQHVLEPLSGYLWLGARLLRGETPAGEAFNFGPAGDMIQPVAGVVKTLGRFWKSFQYEMNPADNADKKECGLLKLCCDKALAMLDWKAALDFEETMRYTAEWYARYYAGGGDMWNFTQGQIAAYVNTAAQRNILWALR